MEDEQEVQKKVEELNKNYPPAKWDSVEGFHSTSVVNIQGTSQSIDPSRGVTLKLFVNIQTNEIKFFYYKDFLKPVGLLETLAKLKGQN